MSRLCLSAALLLLLGALVASTPGDEESSLVRGKSWLTSPVQSGRGKGGEAMKGAGGRGGVGVPTLSGFALARWAVLTPETFLDSQKEIIMFSALRQIIPPKEFPLWCSGKQI